MADQQPAEMTLVCYCFGYSEADIVHDVAVNSMSTILERIVAEKKAGGCHCTEKNPRGR